MDVLCVICGSDVGQRSTQSLLCGSGKEEMYDVAIIGAGPAGMAVAKHLDPKLKVVMFDKGKAVNDRTSITSGFGGAGTFSDGKLIISDIIGGNIREYTKRPEYYLELAAQMFDVSGYMGTKLNYEQRALLDRASKVGVELIATNTHHLGTDGIRMFTERMHQELSKKCEIRLETEVEMIIPQGDDTGSPVEFIIRTNNETINAKYVALAPGREGSKWLAGLLKGLKVGGNKVDLGIRVEVPNAVTEELVNFGRDFKAHYYTKAFDDMVRTFCVCPSGEVVREEFDGLTTCNGHSFKVGVTSNTNFALLVSVPFGDPIDPNEFGRSIVSLANNIAKGGVVVQRLGDLLDGRRSTESRIAKSVVRPTLDAFPGDLSLVLPYRYLTDLTEMIETLDKIAPGMMAEGNMLYGVEVKFYSNVIKLDKMESTIPNLFCVGDGSGVSRGIIQAAASGIIAAETINEREK